MDTRARKIRCRRSILLGEMAPAALLWKVFPTALSGSLVGSGPTGAIHLTRPKETVKFPKPATHGVNHFS